MATGGGDFSYEDPGLDKRLEHDDDEQEVDRTRPFQLGAASTPYHGGETIEMQTRQHEKTGLPLGPETSYQETSDTTPLLGIKNITDEEVERRLKRLRRDPVTGLLDTKNVDTRENLLSVEDHKIEIEKVKDFIRARYKEPNFKDLGVIRFSTKKPIDIVNVGPNGGETKILLDNGKCFRADFLNKTFVKKSLGTRVEQIITEDRSSIREECSQLRAAEKQLEQAEQLSYQMEKEKKKVEGLRDKIEQTQAKIDSINSEQGSNLEHEAELRRLKQLKKNYQTDLENKKKELTSLTKQARNREKEQAKVDRLRATITAKRK